MWFVIGYEICSLFRSYLVHIDRMTEVSEKLPPVDGEGKSIHRYLGEGV